MMSLARGVPASHRDHFFKLPSVAEPASAMATGGLGDGTEAQPPCEEELQHTEAEMESLKEFTFLLAEQVRALELLVQDQAREIAFLTEGHSQTRRTETAHGNGLGPQMQQGGTVSMYGSSAVLLATTVEVEATGTESTTELESV